MIIKEHDKTEANTDSKSKKITLYFRLVKMNTHMIDGDVSTFCLKVGNKLSALAWLFRFASINENADASIYNLFH